MNNKNYMANILLTTYVSILTLSTIILSGFFFSLEQFCSIIFNSRFSDTRVWIHILILFGACFSFEKIFKKKHYKGRAIIYITPLILFVSEILLHEWKNNKIANDNLVIIDRAVITKKTHSKLTWFAVAKFKLDNDSIKKQFEIDGNLLKQKKIGDTILIKYVKDCPKICMHFNFSPSRDEIAYYIGGKLITPTSSMKDEIPAPR